METHGSCEEEGFLAASYQQTEWQAAWSMCDFCVKDLCKSHAVYGERGLVTHDYKNQYIGEIGCRRYHNLLGSQRLANLL